jgi:hypothetical protein
LSPLVHIQSNQPRPAPTVFTALGVNVQQQFVAC